MDALAATCGSVSGSYWGPYTFAPGDRREYVIPMSTLSGTSGTLAFQRWNSVAYMFQTVASCSYSGGSPTSCTGSGSFGAPVFADQVVLSGTGWQGSGWISAEVRWTANDDNPCNVDSCNGGVPAHSVPADDAGVEGTPCPSTDACKMNRCAAGACVYFANVPVDDGNTCTTDSCSSSTGVSHVWNGTCSVPSGAGTLPTTDPYDFGAATSSLWSGNGNIDARRVAVVRGVVKDAAGTGVAAATVSIVGHSEWGSVQTRGDGWYDIAVNGGADVVVAISKSGLLPVQRTVETRWRDFTVAPDVRLIAPADPSASVTVNASSWQRAVGPVVTEPGQATRQQVLIFQPNTNVAPLSSGSTFAVRMTEYTVGPDGAGRERMPGTLPPTSLYTYAAELGLEANGNPVASPSFDKDVFAYVQDIGGFPKNWRVPSAWYDHAAGLWKAMEWSGADGCVVEYTGMSGNLALLDGCGIAFSAGEREQFALAYPNLAANTRLWRVPLRHFSSVDFNWSGGAPNGAQPPLNDDDPAVRGAKPHTTRPDPKDCDRFGSIIECSNQVLAEEIPVIGTPYVLRYGSDWTEKSGTTISVPITGKLDSMPPLPLERIEVEVQVAGQRIVQKYWAPFSAMRVVDVQWDHRDAYQNFVQGTRNAVVNLHYVYKATANNGQNVSGSSFGLAGTGASDQTVDRANRELYWTRRWVVRVGGFDAQRLRKLGGWTLSAEHVYEPESGGLFGGDGSRGGGLGRTNVVSTLVGGNATVNEPTQGASAASVKLTSQLGGVAVGPSGRTYFGYRSQIWSVDPITGTLNVEAGTKDVSFSVYPDGGVPATSVGIDPLAIVVGPDESLWVAEGNNYRVTRFSAPPNRLAYRVAGLTGATSPQGGWSGDGGPATSALLGTVLGLARAADGTIYLADNGNNRIRQITPGGLIFTAAGNGAASGGGDGVGAEGLAIGPPMGVAWARTGEVMFSAGNRVRAIRANGNLVTLAGNDNQTATFGAEGPAAAARMSSPKELAIAADGTLFMRAADGVNNKHVVHTITTDLTFHDFIRGGASADGEPPNNTNPGNYGALAPHPDGCLVYADREDVGGQRVRRVCPVVAPTGSEYLVPREDGAEVYRFDLVGRHLRTVSSLRGVDRAVFSRPNGLVASISDGNTPIANVITIDRGTADVVKIRAPSPGSQETRIDLDPTTKMATKITLPDGRFFVPVHQPTGLMTALTDPRGNQHTYQYEKDALLKIDKGPQPGSMATLGTQLTRTVGMQGRTVQVRTPEQADWIYQRLDSPQAYDGGVTLERFNVTDPTGVVTATESRANDAVRQVGPAVTQGAGVDGRAWDNLVVLGADPRWKRLAPITAQSVTRTRGIKSNFMAADLESTVTTTVSATATGGNPFALTGSQALVRQVAVKDGTIALGTFTQSFDATASKWTMTTPSNRTSEVMLDARDRPTLFRANGTAGGATLADVSVHYDDWGRPDTVTQSTRIHRIGYDTGTGWVSYLEDPVGRRVTFSRNASSGRVTSIDLPKEGSQTRQLVFQYASLPSGELQSLTVPKGASHGVQWNGVDFLSKYTPPTGPGETTYFYDRDRRVVGESTMTSSLAYSYDGAGRIASVSRGTDTVTFGYHLGADKTGQLASVSVTNGPTLGFDYGDGAAGQARGAPLARIRYGGLAGPAHEIAYGYDGLLRRRKRRIDGGMEVAWDYDSDGLLSTISVGGKTLTVSRGTNGMYTGSTIVSGGVTDTVATYNAYGEPMRIDVGTNGTCQRIDYGRDGLGRISTKTMTGQVNEAWVYGYDGAGRLRTATKNGVDQLGAAGTYDADGNREDSRTYDPQDRIVSGGGWSQWFYSAEGAITGIGQGGGPVYQWTHDPLGNQRSATGPGRNMTYAVDGLNRRVIVRNYGTITHQYLWDEDGRIAAHLDASGAVTAQFVYGTRSHSPDLMVAYPSGKVYRFVHDQVGSIVLVLDTDAPCTAAQTITYSVFGIPSFAGQGAGWQPFAFAGGLYDEITTQTRFGAREYDGWSGRWFSKDRSRFGGGSNFYVYCASDPVNCVDPTGRTGIFFWGSAGVHNQGPIRAAAEGVLLMGLDTSEPGFLYTGLIGAVGAEVGGEANYCAGYYGYEVTSGGHAEPIFIAEANVGAELPFIAGLGITAGVFSTPDSIGAFFGTDGGLAAGGGGHLAQGVGISLSRADVPRWLQRMVPPPPVSRPTSTACSGCSK